MIAEVIIDISNSEIDKIYDYFVPLDFPKKLIGHKVEVAFGKKLTQGFIIGIKDESDYDIKKIKTINKIIDENPSINEEMIKLMKFMKDKLLLRYIDCLRLFVPSEVRNNKSSPVYTKYYTLNNSIYKTSEIKTKQQKEIIDYLLKNKELHSVNVKNFSLSAIKSLLNKKIISVNLFQKFRKSQDFLVEKNQIINLSKLQQNAIEKIKDNGIYLLHGVTGSGKTEVYMQVIEREITKGKTAIMLVPEISLTPQILKNFKNRFGDEVAILHSGLSNGEKFDEWSRIKAGQAKIVVGARSAIFAPLENIGTIIIDEEHDSSYVSDANPRYNTFDIAKFRSEYNKCSLILGSATPSIETYYKCETGEIKLIEMPSRINGKEMPAIQIVDMLDEIRSGNNSIFSRKLIDEMEEQIKNNKQIILFLNRRGFVSFMRCRDCGYVAKCSDCEVSLVYHKNENLLKCHFCGKRFKALTKCPECGSSNLKEGAVGTEKVVEELNKIFPFVNIFRMDNDSTKTKNAHQKILEEFSKNKPSILVGTQMIAKGHDFPDVTLVGIIDADQTLYQSHYKSSERTFSLITQVGGRAGRSSSQGKVILQTYNPKKYVYTLAANYDYKKFYQREINLRKLTKFPPFSTIIRILFSGINEDNVIKFTKNYYEKLLEYQREHQNDFLYINVMKSPVSKIKKKYRYQIITKLTNENVEIILKKIYNIFDEIKSLKVSYFIEINPQNLN